MIWNHREEAWPYSRLGTPHPCFLGVFSPEHYLRERHFWSEITTFHVSLSMYMFSPKTSKVLHDYSRVIELSGYQNLRRESVQTHNFKKWRSVRTRETFYKQIGVPTSKSISWVPTFWYSKSTKTQWHNFIIHLNSSLLSAKALKAVHFSERGYSSKHDLNPASK